MHVQPGALSWHSPANNGFAGASIGLLLPTAKCAAQVRILASLRHCYLGPQSLAPMLRFPQPSAPPSPQEASTLRSEQRSLQSALSEAQAEARALAAELAQFKQLAG